MYTHTCTTDIHTYIHTYIRTYRHIHNTHTYIHTYVRLTYTIFLIEINFFFRECPKLKTVDVMFMSVFMFISSLSFFFPSFMFLNIFVNRQQCLQTQQRGRVEQTLPLQVKMRNTKRTIMQREKN